MEIDASRLESFYVGMRVKNYAELCRLFGVEPASGNSKRAQTKEFKRYIDWEKVPGSNALVITAVHPEPLPRELREDAIYANDVLTCLQWDAQAKRRERGLDGDGWFTVTYSLPQVLHVCGFVNPRWTSRTNEIWKAFREFMQEEAPCVTEKQGARFLRKLDTHVGQYCANALDKSLSSLEKKGHPVKMEKGLWVVTGRETRRATAEEEEQYDSLSREVKADLGITRLDLHNRPQYYRVLSKRLHEEMPIDKAYHLREIGTRGSGGAVSIEGYESAKRRVNDHSTEAFYRFVGSDISKDLAKAPAAFQEKLKEGGLDELTAMFSWTPEEAYEILYGEIGNAVRTKEALVSWFVELEGAWAS